MHRAYGAGHGLCGPPFSEGSPMKPVFKPVKAKRLSEQVAQEIKDLI